MDLRLLSILYSAKRGLRLPYIAKLLGEPEEIVKAKLDELVRLGLAVRYGQYYAKKRYRDGRLWRRDRPPKGLRGLIR